MQLLLLAVGPALLFTVPAAEDLVIPSSLDTLLGTWYILRWVGTIPIPRQKRREPLLPFSFVQNYNGKLEFRMYIRKPSGCHLFKLPFTEEADPGSFLTWWRHLIHIWLLTPRTYGVAFFSDKINNQWITMVMLFGRTLDDHPMALELFESLLEEKGLNTREIVVPPHVDACEVTRAP
ncbi:lipocalin-1-like isoform X2 [Heterocephalus glaber]|uniref:Lipocalin-1-like isoform X2 n=1 Tax=Heterocephalus glaber TaxID=10181 RepID=A0AAX6TA75_HETGA|nr:lipocalin-1-like isoform X2 [Heterocephalus glaber]